MQIVLKTEFWYTKYHLLGVLSKKGCSKDFPLNVLSRGARWYKYFLNNIKNPL